jgi:hypothetical protein
MAKQVKKWLVTRIKGSPVYEYGTVDAPNADAAIRKAIKEYEITDPEHVKRLAARQVA